MAGSALLPGGSDSGNDDPSRASASKTWPRKTRFEPRPEANRRRLRRVGRSAAIFVALGLPVFLLLQLLLLDSWTWLNAVEHLAAWSLMGSCWLLAWAAGNPQLSDRAAEWASRTFLVIAAGQTAVFHAAHELHRYEQLTPFGPFLMVIGFLPLVHVAPLGSTIATAGAAALASLAGMVTVYWIHVGPVSAWLVADLIGGLTLGLLIAVVAHRSLQVLRQEAAAGLRLGSYELIEKLGEGGMGEVWKAKHPILARPAAVKLVRAVHLDSRPERREQILRRFRREAQTIASLRCEHTVRLFDHGISEDGNVYLAMELIDGIDLRALGLRYGAQPIDRSRAVLAQICESLAEAHEHGLVHRDVKPANVMLCRQGRRLDQVKVLDFGNVGAGPSEAPGMEPTLTETHSVHGTPAFLAPEVLSDRETATEQTDVYSLGCVAYWLLAGRKVFDHDSPVMLYAAHLRDRPEPLSALGIDLSSGMEELVLRCLAKRPAERPSVNEIVERLDAMPAAGDWSSDQARSWWQHHEAAQGRR